MNHAIWMLYLIYPIVIGGLTYFAVYFWNKARKQKKETEYYTKAYLKAKEAWATQSNAVREKGIECDQLKKKNKGLEKDLEDANEHLGHFE